MKQLQEVERSFRDLKGTLLLPVLQRKDERIRAHALICFLALVLIRLAETRCETSRTIRAELGPDPAGATSAPARGRVRPDQRAQLPSAPEREIRRP